MYRIIGGDKQEYGPASPEELRHWIGEDRLNGESLAREESSQNWRRLSEFPEFREDLEQQAERLGLAGQPEALPYKAAADRSLNVSDCLATGWQLWISNFGLFSAATFMVWTISVTLQMLPFTGLIYWLVRGVLYGGLSLVVLKRLRGEPAQLGEVFTGFGSNFMHLALVGMVTSVLSSLGFFFCVIPGIYLTIIWIFSIPAVIDRNVEFWPAMEESRKAVAGQWPKVFVLALIAFLPTVLVTLYLDVKIFTAVQEGLKEVMPASGPADLSAIFEQMKKIMDELARSIVPIVLLSKVVLLLNLPFGISALISAYEVLLGQSSKRRRN